MTNDASAVLALKKSAISLPVDAEMEADGAVEEQKYNPIVVKEEEPNI